MTATKANLITLEALVAEAEYQDSALAREVAARVQAEI